MADSFFYRLYQCLKTLNALGRLREEVYRSRQVDSVQLVGRLNNDSRIVGLSLQSDHFSMSGLTVDNYLRRQSLVVLVQLVARTDTILQFLDNRTSGIDDVYLASACNPIGAGRFAMRTQEHARAAGQCA